jgi:hypothetical protein
VRALLPITGLCLAACAHGPAPRTAPDVPQRCTLRFASGHLRVDGHPSTNGHAVAYFSHLGGALVYLDDGSERSAWSALG